MSAAAHGQRALDALATQLATYYPQALLDVTADSGPTLREPTAYVVTDDDEAPELSLLPTLQVKVERAPQNEWKSPQTDAPLELIVGVHHQGPKASKADLAARYYGEAVKNALDAIGYDHVLWAIAGVWKLKTSEVLVEPIGEDRYRRRGGVRAVMVVRATREV